ncbi:glycosyltransferase family 2 protein [Chloroflexota bacterium]
MKEIPLVAIITVVWNNLQDTLECLDSLTQLCYPRFQVVVVDNASTDGTPQRVAEQYPSVLLIRNMENQGYAGGCNSGIQFAVQELDAAYICILNNDTIIRDRCFLDRLVESAQQDRSVGVVAPLVRDYPPPHAIQYAGVRVNLYTGRARLITRVEEEPIWTDSVHGSAFLIKREVIDKVGCFDEEFYLYWEEIDYCVRVRRAGYRVLVDRGVEICHKSGGTIGGRSELYTYYFFRNRLLLMQKHAKARHWLGLIPLLPVYALVHIAKSRQEGYDPILIGRSIAEAWSDFRNDRLGRRGCWQD